MKANKNVIAFSMLTLVLIVAITYAVVSIKGGEYKEVRVAKSFIAKLQDMEIIDLNLNLDNVEFKSIEKTGNKSGVNSYTVVGENIGVDLDSKYNVIGFSQKINSGKGIDDVVGAGNVSKAIEDVKEGKEHYDVIGEEKAINIAEKYVDGIVSDKFEFKEIRLGKNKEDDSNNYTIAFYKYFKEYPYYDNEIVVNINKITGKMESFSNISIANINHNLKKNITSLEAKDMTINYYQALNVKAEINKEPLLAVTIRADGNYELSYVIDTTIVGLDGKIDKNKIFINAESGEIVNRTTNMVKVSNSK